MSKYKAHALRQLANAMVYLGQRRTRGRCYWLTVVVRILIADAHEVVRAGLARIVESRSSWEVVAVAGDGKEAVQKAIETKPDIAVIGYALPLIDGIEVTRQIRARLPKTEVLIFTVHDDEAVITQLLHAGARGYLLKSDANRELIAARMRTAWRTRPAEDETLSFRMAAARWFSTVQRLMLRIFAIWSFV